MIKKATLFTLIALIFFLGLNTAKSNAMMMSKAKMMKTEMFFMHHSLGFPSIFYKFHPGPHWILMHAKSFNLNSSQLKQEKMLTMGMMHNTIKGVMMLKKALRQYKMDAMQNNPSISKLISDVKAVGNAETYLGYEMIPFHIKGYRVLYPSQQSLYHRLAKMNWMKKMQMMRKQMMKKMQMMH
ncbi:MAG: hypothetical protein EVJ46_09225 [Candidatus Acididesulfobacter guangdongensis]|uniref:Uncharacterized protein n=1 Tax=Acididesulfobacter guangdongensis TaxID=2597225 RepID=A0A519BEL5_ACIG2|nr:MAG: hypothetical protein EVJ46_09225 [Candidatus Acididesulfobacter guangdongensis]